MDNKEIDKEQNDTNIEENQEEILEEQRNVYIYYQNIYNNGVMTGNDSIIENINIKSKEGLNRKNNKQSVTTNDKTLINWITQNYANYSMALMIACIVFNEMPRDWIVKAADDLFEKIHIDNEKEKGIYAFSDMIEPFGLEVCKGSLNMYGGLIEVDIIRLIDKEKRAKILSILWNQCLNLREKIIIWLNEFNGKRPYRMSKEAIVAVEIFSSEDYCFFVKRIIPIIMNNRTMYANMLMARTLTKMQKKYESNVVEMIKQWGQKRDVDYLLTTMLFCIDKPVFHKDTLECAIENYFKFGLDDYKNVKNQYYKHAFDLYAVGQRVAVFYKLLIHHLYERLLGKRGGILKSNVGIFFMLLFKADIEFTRYDNKKTPIFFQLSYINDEVRIELCKIWEIIWSYQRLKEEMYRYLARYENKVVEAGIESQLEKFIYYVFGNICSSDIQESICTKVRRIANE